MYLWAAAAFVVLIILTAVVRSDWLGRGDRRRAIEAELGRRGQEARVVSGVVAASGEALRAPLSGRKCVYWRIDVERWRPGDDRTAWNASDRSDFVVEADGSDGAVWVVARDMEHEAPGDPIVTADDALVAARLGALGFSPRKRETLTAHERIIAVGEEVEVIAAGTTPDGDPYRQSAKYRETLGAPGLVRSRRTKEKLLHPSPAPGGVS